MAHQDSDVDGILLVDKPVGPTSHDVVAAIRRALSTRAVGHAGTLDPAASGVLVLAIGQGTKLVAHLTSHTKRYRATVCLGVSTTTLDAEGEVVSREPIPASLAQALARGDLNPLAPALEQERQRRQQIPPQFSAIKLHGRPAYQSARRGEHVALPPRAVVVHELSVTGVSGDSLALFLSVSKGYYVRALARDLGEALGVPAHLSNLRRLSSGPFHEEECVPLHAPPSALRDAVIPVAQAARRALAAAELTDEGARRALHGQSLQPGHFVARPDAGVSAWFDPAGKLIALGRSAAGDDCKPVRVFT